MNSSESNKVSFLGLVGGGEILEKKAHAEEQVLYFLKKAQEVIEAKGLSQADLARAIGVKRSQVNRWLTNDSGLNAKSMFLIADGLGYKLHLDWVPANVVSSKSEVQYDSSYRIDGPCTISAFAS